MLLSQQPPQKVIIYIMNQGLDQSVSVSGYRPLFFNYMSFFLCCAPHAVALVTTAAFLANFLQILLAL